MQIPDRVKHPEKYKDKKADAKEIDAYLKRREEQLKGSSPRLALGGKPFRMLLVIAVLAVVGGMLLARAKRTSPANRARRDYAGEARENVRVLRVALECFRVECGHYPTEREGGLVALVGPRYHVPGWTRAYVDMVRPDPWLIPYQYRVQDGKAVLFSSGPDKTPGTADDIHPAITNLEQAVANMMAGRGTKPFEPDVGDEEGEN